MKQSCGRRWFLAVVASGALAWSGAAAAQVETAGVVQLEQFVARTRQAAGSFEQTVTASSGRRPQVSSGTFVFMRPGKFRWAYERPYPQLLVSDGERLWSWDEDLNQVTMRVLGDALGSTPAAVLTGDGALAGDFELADAGPADGLQWVVATPRQADSSFESMRLGFAQGMLHKMALRDNFGQMTVIVFTEFDAEAGIDPTLFHFVPPLGADVIGGD
nr:outer membrane lipoprotein chaperone LolA [Zoogloeaceae bacterium]